MAIIEIAGYEVVELNCCLDVNNPIRLTLRTVVFYFLDSFSLFLSFSFFTCTFTAKAVSISSHVHYIQISKAVLSNMMMVLF